MFAIQDLCNMKLQMSLHWRPFEWRSAWKILWEIACSEPDRGSWLWIQLAAALLYKQQPHLLQVFLINLTEVSQDKEEGIISISTVISVPCLIFGDRIRLNFQGGIYTIMNLICVLIRFLFFCVHCNVEVIAVCLHRGPHWLTSQERTYLQSSSRHHTVEHIASGCTWLTAFADWVKTDRAFPPHLIMPDTTGFHYINSLLISMGPNFPEILCDLYPTFFPWWLSW